MSLNVVELTKDQISQVAALISETRDTEKLQESHRCWFQMPDPIQMCHLAKYAHKPDCPKCGGLVYVQVYHGNIGDSLAVKCRGHQGKPCDFSDAVDFDGERL